MTAEFIDGPGPVEKGARRKAKNQKRLKDLKASDRLAPDDPRWDERGPGTGRYTRREHANLIKASQPAVIASLRKRDEFLAVLKECHSIKRTCELVKVSDNTYAKWRQRDPAFAAEADEARLGYKASQTVDNRNTWPGGFTAFRKQWFGFDTYFHQAQIIAAIETSPDQGITMVLVPPEHGKTTVIEDWICYKLAMDPNVRIGVVSEGQPHARKVLARVKRRLTSGTRFAAKFGPFYEPGQERDGKPWSADRITVWKADHDERDYSVVTCGWRTAVAGSRFDYLICDDIMSRRNLSQVDEVVQTFRQDFLTRPGTRGRTVITGTRVDIGDFYERMEEAVDEFEGLPVVSKVIKLPAMNEQGEALCPEMWPTNALMRKRAIVGADTWWRNYQQQPRSSALSTFTDEMWDSCTNLALPIGQVIPGGITIVSIDPALGGGNSITCLSFDATRIRIVDQVTDRGLASIDQISARFVEFADLYSPTILLIEENAFQRGLANDTTLNELARDRGCRVEPHRTGGGGVRKTDDTIGVAQMARDFTKRVFEIPWAPTQRDRLRPLREELLAWSPTVPTRKRIQDRVMSLWIGWTYAMQYRKVLVIQAEGKGNWRRRTLPFERMRVLTSRGTMR